MRNRELIKNMLDVMESMAQVLALHNAVLHYILDEMKERKEDNKGIFNEMDRDVEKFHIECEEFFKKAMDHD